MATPCKVLFFPFFFLAETWNGMDEHMLLLSRYLDPTQFEVAIIEHEGDGPQTRLLAERGGIQLLHAPSGRDSSVRTRLPALRRLLTSERVSLVHIHSPAAGGQLVPALAARLAGCQVFATYHQVQPRALARKTRWLNRVTHNLLVNQTLAVSADVRQTLANNAGLDPRRIEVVPNGIELNTQTRGSTGLPPRESGEVRVGAFGRLSPEKGLVVLLKAVARLSPDAPRVRLFVAGEGPQRQELDALTRDLHLSDRVTFLGFRDDARALMSEMDIVVHVPEYEGFGLVMAEAMAASRPLVVNDAPGGMTDLVNDGVNGIVVRAGAVDELAAAIERLAGDPARREELGANGLVICRQRYSAESVARTVGAFYQSALT